MTVIPYHHLEQETMETCYHEFCATNGFHFDADSGKVSLKCWKCTETYTTYIQIPSVKICDRCNKITEKCTCQVCLKCTEPSIEQKTYGGKTIMRLPDVEDGWCEGCGCQECGEMPKGTIAEANKTGNPAPKYECECKPLISLREKYPIKDFILKKVPKPVHTYDDDDTVTLQVPKSIMQQVMECFERSGF